MLTKQKDVAVSKGAPQPMGECKSYLNKTPTISQFLMKRSEDVLAVLLIKFIFLRVNTEINCPQLGGWISTPFFVKAIKPLLSIESMFISR